MTDFVEVRRCRTGTEADELALVLAAVGISCRIAPGEVGPVLLAPAAEAERARRELAAYDREQTARPPRTAFPPLSHGIEAAMAYCAVLFFFFGAARRGAFSLDWAALGAANAGLILDGAWWRTLTALCLHVDLQHLLSNLVFGVVAGVLAAQILGPGLAWLAIVVCGGLGNALTALLYVQTPEHTAIGASTAVFAALGLLSGYTQRARSGAWRRGLKRWSPIAAGVLLLVFIGLGGERTDVWAHVSGLAAGVAAGLALAGVPRQAFSEPRRQWQCGGLACGLVALAWALAISAG